LQGETHPLECRYPLAGNGMVGEKPRSSQQGKGQQERDTVQEVEVLHGGNSTRHGSHRMKTRGSLDERNSGKPRIGDLTQRHGQDSS
jgi:hypothetical protein